MEGTPFYVFVGLFLVLGLGIALMATGVGTGQGGGPGWQAIGLWMAFAGVVSVSGLLLSSHLVRSGEPRQASVVWIGSLLIAGLSLLGGLAFAYLPGLIVLVFAVLLVVGVIAILREGFF